MPFPSVDASPFLCTLGLPSEVPQAARKDRAEGPGTSKSRAGVTESFPEPHSVLSSLGVPAPRCFPRLRSQQLLQPEMSPSGPQQQRLGQGQQAAADLQLTNPGTLSDLVI